MELSLYLLDHGTAESASLRNVRPEWYVCDINTTFPS